MGESRPHVVVVDDAEEVRTLFSAILAESGCRATLLAAAPSPDELARLAPHAVVLDLLLGTDEEAAWRLVEAMRADPRLRPVPVIVCSAATPLLRGLAGRFAAMGVATLPKPFDLDLFFDLLADALGEERVLSP